jgi:hypothetical protein
MSSKDSKPMKDKGKERKTNKFKVSHSAPCKGKDGSNNKPKTKPAWRYQWKGNETTMVRDGKTWYWCEYHGFWCKHETKACRAKRKVEGVHADDRKVKRRNGVQTSSTSSPLSIVRALLAISEDDEIPSNIDL